MNFKLDDRSTIGLFAFGNGGMNSEYAVNPFTPFGAGSSPIGVNLEQLFLSVNYSRKITERLTLGLGPVLAIQRFSATGLELFQGFSAAPAQVTNNRDDWSHGLGLSLGVL